MTLFATWRFPPPIGLDNDHGEDVHFQQSKPRQVTPAIAKELALRQRNRLIAGAFALLAAGSLATVPSSVATASPVNPVTRLAGPATRLCSITLPGGIKAVVTDRAGQESAELVDPTAASGGMFSFGANGHQIMLPAAALRSIGTVGIDRYDTTALAERACGFTAPAATGATEATDQHGGNGGGDDRPGYQLARLTVHTIGPDGTPTEGIVLLANVDDNGLARPDLVTGGDGVAKIAVPVGHYAALYIVSGGGDYASVVADTEFSVTNGSQVTLDARTATRSIPTPTTPKLADLASSALELSRGSGNGDGVGYGYWFEFLDLSSQHATMMINPTATAPKHGHFTVNPSFEFASPAGVANPYSYHITEATEGVPASFPTTVNPAGLATVTRNYGAVSAPGLAVTAVSGEPAWESHTRIFGLKGIDFIPTGQTRTEYFSAGKDLVWQTIFEDTAFFDEIVDSDRTYLPGQHLTENFDTGALHPTELTDPVHSALVCGSCSNDTNLLFDILPLGDDTPGHVAFSSGVVAPDSESYSFSLWRNGSLLANAATDLEGTEITVPKGTARYELQEMNTRHIAAFPLSTDSTTRWTFTTDPGHGGAIPGDWLCIDGTGDCSALPLLFASYDADANLLNQLTPGRHGISIAVGHQQHAVAPSVTGATVSVSYDDGATWQALHTTGSGGTYHAGFTVPAGAVGGYASLRVSAWDGAGNRIDQTVTHAYQVR